MSNSISSNPNILRRLAVSTIATLGALGLIGCAQDAITSKTGPTKEYEVKPGDTAWGIADNALAEEEEIRPLVDDIADQAGSDGLQTGERIQIPLFPADK